MMNAPALESLFGALSDGVCVSDGGRIAYLNPAAERLLEARPAGEESRTICDLLCGRIACAGESECASKCPLRDPARPGGAHTVVGGFGSGPAYTWREEGVRRVDERRPLRVRCLRVPGTGDAGRQGVHLTLIEDGSAEAEAERRKKDWRGMIVRDLRAPLAGVLSALRVLQVESDGGARDRAMLDIAVRGCRGAAQFVQLYLDLARLDAARMPVVLAPVDVAPAARRAVEELAFLARERGVGVDVDVPPDLRCRADEGLLARVLQNLLHNALAFSPEGGRVFLSAEAAASRCVAVSVRDQGPGIPPEDIPRLFQRFTQGAVPARKGQGAGLGLAFCREALKVMGGEISVACGPEGGATFTALLPADRRGKARRMLK